MRKPKNGFTLVELSIVLVIIGLLIGGILVAQSMISTAKLTATIRELDQFDAAIANFQTKYKDIPGDSVAMGCNDGYCGDGILQDASGYPRPGSLYNSGSWGNEFANFWTDLQNSGFQYKNSTFSSNPIGNDGLITKGTVINAPPAELADNIGITPISTGSSTLPDLDNLSLYYMMCELHNDASGSGNIGCYNGGGIGTNPMLAQALDSKMDDGQARTGRIRAYDATENTCSSPGNYLDGVSHTTGNYSPTRYGSQGTKGCYLYIKANISASQ